MLLILYHHETNVQTVHIYCCIHATYIRTDTAVYTDTVCMYSHQSTDQPGKIAKPARGQLNRNNKNFPVPALARKFVLERQAWPSRPASVCSFSILRLNLLLTRGIPPDFREDVYLFIPPYAMGSIPSLSGRATCVPMTFAAESLSAQSQ